MRALVTGGAGLIGSHVVDLLLEEDWDVVVIDNLEGLTHADVPRGQWPVWCRPRDADYRYADVRYPGALAPLMRDVDVVFHQAAYGGFTDELRRYGDVNVGGTANVVAQAARAGVGRVVVASSQAVYGARQRVRWQDGIPWTPQQLREDGPVDPRSPYALSKWHAERLALEAGGELGLDVVALRYALTYGPRQSTSNPYTGVCSIFATRLLNGLAPVVYEDGMQTRDFTFVEDVAAANLLVAGDGRAVGRVFNVGRGTPTTVNEFVARLRGQLEVATGTTLPATELPGRWRPHDARHVVTDPSLLEALGWHRRTSLEGGLRRYVEWFLEQPRPADVFGAAEARLRRSGVVR